MATRNPVTCEYCGKREGYLGCFSCKNHICHKCAEAAAKRFNSNDRHACPSCGGTQLAANAGDRW